MQIDCFRQVKSLINNITDPRKKNIRHKMSDIFVLTFVAVYSGCTDFVMIQNYCHCRRKIIRQFFGIGRIPSHDTFNRVFSLINPDLFESLFRIFMENHINLEKIGFKHIALDGKTVSNSNLHTVTAFATQSGLSLASQDTGAGKKNELSTMIDMVNHLKLKDTVITTDAMGCNEKLFTAIIKQKGDYVIQLKANQGNALDSVKTFFDLTPIPVSFSDDITKERKGIVKREYFVNTKLKNIPFLEFTGLKSIVKVLKTITKKDGTIETEQRYYLSSMTDINEIAKAIRGHWRIENNLHWTLDVQFKEDNNLVRDKNCQKNLSLMRKIVINSFKLQGIVNKRQHMQTMMFCEDTFFGLMKKILK